MPTSNKKHPVKSSLPTDHRRSGALMHISSLPGPYLAGDLGSYAYRFVDHLRAAKQSWWQTLPINPIGLGNSPYSSSSSFASETMYISEEGLYEQGLIKKSDMLKTVVDRDRVVFTKAFRQKKRLLDLAFQNFTDKSKRSYNQKYLKFKSENKDWLDDFAYFTVLSAKWGGNWAKWPKEFRTREKSALLDLAKSKNNQLERIKFAQFEFSRQWQALRKYAKSQGVFLMGDIPIFVSHESSDVWSAPEQFFLKKNGQPSSVAGCPPDKFCVDGQMWGNALYDWKVMKKDGFSWWIKRFEQLVKSYDAVRLDHFIGFYNYWKIPASAKNAKSGRWEKAEGGALFETLEKKFGRLPLLAEDLGKVTQEVWDLRDRFGFPGMKVLQFGFADAESLAVHRCHRLDENSILYSGTHDNDNSVGWYRNALKEKPPKHLNDSMKATFKDANAVGSEMIKLGMHSPCKTFIYPVQDVLNLGSRHRMNIPGTPKGNWEFRLDKQMWAGLNKHAGYLKALSQVSERN